MDNPKSSTTISASNWRVFVSTGHEGNKVRSIVIDKARGIKALYDIEDKKFIQFLHKKGRGWTEDQAVEWTKSFISEIKNITHVSVDQIPEFLHVIVEKKSDGEVVKFNPHSPSFILGGEEVVTLKNWPLYIDGVVQVADDHEYEEVSLEKAETFEKGKYHRARILDPEKFQKDTFRIIPLAEEMGLFGIVGRLKDKDSTTLQAYLFSVDKFTIEQAHKWLEDHEIKPIEFIEGTMPEDKGGAGSGNFGHGGRPGEIGGSAESGQAQIAGSQIAQTQGASVSFRGNSPKTGFMVSPYKDREKVLSWSKKDKADLVSKLKEYRDANKDKLTQAGHFLGAWVNDKGKLVLDVAQNVKDQTEAEKIGRTAKQDAIWDVVNMKEIKL